MSLLFLGGVQLLSMGILGEYLGRVDEEVKRRPLYILSEMQSPYGPTTPLASLPRAIHTHD